MAQVDELRELIYCADVPATVGTRARIVLWYAENRPKKEIAAMAGVSRPTVNLWLSRYAAEGVAGLLERKRGAGREQVPGRIRARILAATRSAPPEGLSHWSSREMVKFIARTEEVTVSHHYVATLWRETGLKPHRQGTFKLSRDPRFAEKVADIVGLYLDPPGAAVVLSVDEKTQVQALDRTQPLLPIDFGVTEKRTHDYIRHGTTNLFAALDVGSGEVYGECHPTRDGAQFLAFLKAAVKPHAGKDIHVDPRQPVHPHHPGRGAVAHRQPPRQLPLHPGRILVDEPDRNLVRHHHPPGDPTRHLHLGQGPHHADP